MRRRLFTILSALSLLRGWGRAYCEWDERTNQRLSTSRPLNILLVILLWAMMLAMLPLFWMLCKMNGKPLGVVVVPVSVAVVVAVGAPVTLACRHRLRTQLMERRRLTGLCPHCGYDLRATADRCPECGEPVPQRAAGAVTSATPAPPSDSPGS